MIVEVTELRSLLRVNRLRRTGWLWREHSNERNLISKLDQARMLSSSRVDRASRSRRVTISTSSASRWSSARANSSSDCMPSCVAGHGDEIPQFYYSRIRGGRAAERCGLPAARYRDRIRRECRMRAVVRHRHLAEQEDRPPRRSGSRASGKSIRTTPWPITMRWNFPTGRWY